MAPAVGGGAILAVSSALTIGLIAGLFLSAPFASDEAENRIKGWIGQTAVFAGKTAVLNIPIVLAFAKASALDDEAFIEEMQQKAIQQVIELSQKPSCFNCKYKVVSAHLSPCAVHPGRQERYGCTDWVKEDFIL